MKDFINDARIEQILEEARSPEHSQVEEIIAKSKELKGLTPQETAVLLQTEDPRLGKKDMENGPADQGGDLRQSASPVCPPLHIEPLC